jgi:hypothetical protein
MARSVVSLSCEQQPWSEPPRENKNQKAKHSTSFVSLESKSSAASGKSVVAKHTAVRSATLACPRGPLPPEHGQVQKLSTQAIRARLTLARSRSIPGLYPRALSQSSIPELYPRSLSQSSN